MSRTLNTGSYIYPNKVDFKISERLALVALKDIQPSGIKDVYSLLIACLDLFKQKYGKHPKFCRHANILSAPTSERPQKKYTKAEKQEFESALPWDCFPNTKNAIDLFNRIVAHPDYGFLEDDMDILCIFLALMIKKTPKEPDNAYSIITAGQLLGLCLLEQARQAPSKEEKQRKKRAGNKRGLKKIAENKKAQAASSHQQIRGEHARLVKDGVAKPPRKTIAANLGVSVKTVNRALE